MVKEIAEKIKESISSVEPHITPYELRGYHLFIEATKSNIIEIANFFKRSGFYLADMCCVDYIDYLEIVYLFNNHSKVCRIKVALKVEPDKPSAPTISHIYNIAHWYEREIHEFFGVLFDGHSFMTYLFLHDQIDFYPLRKKQIPVPEEDKKLLNSFKPEEQEDGFFLNLGPQHPSTHGVLRVVVKMNGEYILEAIPVLGYLHRMHEKMAENRTYQQFYPNAARMDYLGALNFNLGYVTTVEKLCGIEVPERAQYIRTITCELNRISSHLLWLGAFLADLGGLTPFLYTFDDREQILDILEAVTGSRLTYSYFRFGGLFNDVDDDFVDGVKKFINRLRSRFDMYERLVTGNVIFINRVKDIGVMDYTYPIRYGCSGPVIRSLGIPFDIRKHEPYGVYDRIDFKVAQGTNGDNMDRYLVRIQEMEISLDIIEKALKDMPSGPINTEKLPKKLKPPKGDIYHTVESPRGELGVYIVSDESDIPYRMRWRVPSYSNLMTFPELARGTLIADAIATLGSYDLVIPEIDR